MARNPRNSLSAERIVSAAQQLADRAGLDAVTMRNLADDLGTRPMSLYHHVATKDALLSAVVDSVFAEVSLPGPDLPWRNELAERARSMRAALRRHPWALRVMETQRQPGRASLANHEAVLEVLRRQGFSVRAAAHSYAVLDAFVYGFALQESMLTDVGLMDAPDELAQGMDLAASPRIGELAALYVASPASPFEDTFEVGLTIVLDGIARLAASSADESHD